MAELRLEAVRGNRADALLEVIFLHGLTGDAIETWQSEQAGRTVFWPEWIVAAHPGASVFSLGYPAGATRWFSASGAGMALPDRGRQVLDYLVSRGRFQRPTLLVAHSLGGLLAKQLLRLSHEMRDPRFANVVPHTRMVVFLATPHAGSSLSNLLQALPGARESWPVKDLEANNPYLDDLSEWYRNNAPHLGIVTHAHRENLTTMGVMVVDAASADPQVSGCMVMPQDADHSQICKPASPTSPVAASIIFAVGTLLQQLTPRAEISAIAGTLLAGAAGAPAPPESPRLGGQDVGFTIVDPGPRWAVQWTSQADQFHEIGIVDQDFYDQFDNAGLGPYLRQRRTLLLESEQAYEVLLHAQHSTINGHRPQALYVVPQKHRVGISYSSKFVAEYPLRPSVWSHAVQALVQGIAIGFTPLNMREVDRPEGGRAVSLESALELRNVVINGVEGQDLSVLRTQMVFEAGERLYLISIDRLDGPLIPAADSRHFQALVDSFRVLPSPQPGAALAQAQREAQEVLRCARRARGPQLVGQNLILLLNHAVALQLLQRPDELQRRVGLLLELAAELGVADRPPLPAFREAWQNVPARGPEQLVDVVKEAAEELLSRQSSAGPH